MMKSVKQILSVILFSALAIVANGQQSISYQAVVRNASGEIVSNQQVSFRLSIFDNLPQGVPKYQEKHVVNTNQFGIVNMQIGNGTPLIGSFSAINWGNGNDKFLRVEVDLNGGSSFLLMGTSQLLSVPYSLHSEETGKLTVMSSAQRDAIETPQLGMTIINSDSRRINFYDGYGWLEVTGMKQADFSCGNPLLDSRNGTYYNTVEIAGNCWMAENLNIGTMIQGTTNPSDDGAIEKYCYSNNQGSCNTYGALYQWNEMMQYSGNEGSQGICPEGWHIPTDAEWTALINATGGPDNAGENLIEGGSSGFEALWAGYREPQTSGYPFAFIGSKTYFWSSSSVNSIVAYDRHIFKNDSHAYTGESDVKYGYSVRCVMD
jgi:uncharacterized protein (TIGR02145 family)